MLSTSLTSRNNSAWNNLYGWVLQTLDPPLTNMMVFYDSLFLNMTETQPFAQYIFLFCEGGRGPKNNLSLLKCTSIWLGSKGVQGKSDIVILYNIFNQSINYQSNCPPRENNITLLYMEGSRKVQISREWRSRSQKFPANVCDFATN